jgi:hypothetical protein
VAAVEDRDLQAVDEAGSHQRPVLPCERNGTSDSALPCLPPYPVQWALAAP